jgi:hypothetical protein
MWQWGFNDNCARRPEGGDIHTYKEWAMFFLFMRRFLWCRTFACYTYKEFIHCKNFYSGWILSMSQVCALILYLPGFLSNLFKWMKKNCPFTTLDNGSPIGSSVVFPVPGLKTTGLAARPRKIEDIVGLPLSYTKFPVCYIVHIVWPVQFAQVLPRP